MGLQGKSVGNLAVESHAALEPWNGRKEPVEVTSTAPETATVKGEAYAGNEDKVQFVQREDRALETRLQDAKAAGGEVAQEVGDAGGFVGLGGGGVAGEGDELSGREGGSCDGENVRLALGGEKEAHGAGALPLGPGFETLADEGGGRGTVGGRESRELRAKMLSPVVFGGAGRGGHGNILFMACRSQEFRIGHPLR